MNLKQKKKIIIVLIVLNLFAWSAIYDLVIDQNLKVTFFDVGQGDAIFIETPDNYQILVDGGPTDRVLEKLGENMYFWDKKIDLVVLTHADHDHLAGLVEVLKKYQVDYVLWNGLLKETGECDEWQKLLENEKIDQKIGFAGQKIKTSNLYFDILYPFKELEEGEVSDFNDTSIVLRLVFGDKAFLLTGDLSKSGERDLVEKGFVIASDVLKLGHHGSKTSSADDFIRVVNPDYGVISAGRNNRYNHPHQEVLDVLSKYDISILRTDRDEDIQFISDGQNININ